MGLSVEQGSGLAATMKILQTWATYQLFVQKEVSVRGCGQISGRVETGRS